MLRLGAGRLTVVDVDRERAEACARRLGAEVGTLESVADADGLIHATPTGMEGHPGLPLDEELLHPALWVADIVYRPLETELLRCARELGCRTLDGGGMAVFQAADSFELFTGVEPDRERMLRHFAELVGAVTAMRRSIATVCLSGTLEEKLAAAARAGFDGVELFEADLVNSPLAPAEVRSRPRRSA